MEFKESFLHGTAGRHTDWPSELDRLDVRSNLKAIILVQAFQPIPNRFDAGFGAIENRLNTFHLIRHGEMYQKRYDLAIVNLSSHSPVHIVKAVVSVPVHPQVDIELLDHI